MDSELSSESVASLAALREQGFMFKIMRSGFTIWYSKPTQTLLRNPAHQVANVKFAENVESEQACRLARERAVAHLVSLRLEA